MAPRTHKLTDERSPACGEVLQAAIQRLGVFLSGWYCDLEIGLLQGRDLFLHEAADRGDTDMATVRLIRQSHLQDLARAITPGVTPEFEVLAWDCQGTDVIRVVRISGAPSPSKCPIWTDTDAAAGLPFEM